MEKLFTELIKIVPRKRLKGPRVLIHTTFHIEENKAELIAQKMAQDNIGSLASLLRRLLEYYLADHDGYKIRRY